MFIPDRFAINGQCIEYLGAKRKGYGMYNHKSVHRVTYEMFKGPIPDGLIIRHTCNNKACCNPEHLIVGTQADNMRDKERSGYGINQHQNKTHCKNGHEFNESNTYYYPKMRACKTCAIARVNKQRASSQPQ